MPSLRTTAVFVLDVQTAVEIVEMGPPGVVQTSMHTVNGSTKNVLIVVSGQHQLCVATSTVLASTDEQSFCRAR